MTDIATTLTNAMNRAMDSIIDDVAKDGLKVLRRVLHDAGFTHSEHLKNFEVQAHVTGKQILFEIILDIEAVEPEDKEAERALEEQAKKLEEVEQRASRTYRLRRGEVQRVQRDARKPARDARKTAADRLLEHEIALRSPRSARITRSGKLAVSLSRSIRETATEVKFPEGEFQGIIGKFIDELKTVISDRFVPELRDIVERYAS